MKIWKISLNGQPGPTVTSLSALGATIEGEADGLEPDDGFQIEIRAGEMAQEDYDQLPEFGGW